MAQPTLSFDFSNSLEQAWNEAHANHKALAILWSIDWCPPCNRLKTELVAKPQLMTGLDQIVTAYQDGDQPEAQSIAADLYLSSYPTLALIKPEQPYPTEEGAKLVGKELYRLRGDLSSGELETALSLADRNLMPMEDMLNKDFAQFMTADQWQLLSFVDFMPFKEFLSSDALIQIFKKLVAAVPHDLPTAKAQFSSYFLQYMVERLDGMAPEYRDKVLPVIQDAVTHLGASSQTMYQVRSFLVEEAEPFLRVLGKSFPSGEGDAVVSEIATSLRAWGDHLLSEGQLSPFEAQAYRLVKAKHARTVVPTEELGKLTSTLVETNHSYARNGGLSLLYSSYCHNATVSESAGGDPRQRDEAVALLKEQILRRNNPSFYAMKLADHYLADGEAQLALDAMDQAVELAFDQDGEATQLQWLASQFRMGLTLREKGRTIAGEQLFAPVDRFLNLAGSIPDGFKGRNYRQAFALYRLMAQNPELKDVSERYTDLNATLDARIEAAST